MGSLSVDLIPVSNRRLFSATNEGREGGPRLPKKRGAFTRDINNDDDEKEEFDRRKTALRVNGLSSASKASVDIRQTDNGQ